MDKILKRLEGQKILILGFGKEGKSSLAFLKEKLPGHPFTLADENPGTFTDIENDGQVSVISGPDYLDRINDFDVIIKSPGISFSQLKDRVDRQKITSQTGLFLSQFRDKVIGITGTKGKSTTTSLIYHILNTCSYNAVLTGNIGIPPFDITDRIKDDTCIVYEMSSHQLENITVSPHIAVILNLFEEHLDHYENLQDYHSAKLNIARYQNENDFFIYNFDDKSISTYLEKNIFRGKKIPFSKNADLGSGVFLEGQTVIFKDDGKTLSKIDFGKRKNLPGTHNLLNIMVAIAVAKLSGCSDEVLLKAVQSYKGLPHRLEYIGRYGGIDFYDDSISTVPESTIEALKTLNNVDTLILGGKDRGIDYGTLIEYLSVSEVKNIILTGPAGKRIYSGLKTKQITGDRLFLIERFDEMAGIIKNKTSKGTTCLLSPAAPSYDIFENFIERGNCFSKMVKGLFLDE